MTYEKWLDLKDKIQDKFGVDEYTKGTLEDVPDSTTETLIFNSPLGKIKLEWVSKPRTLGEKTVYSNRIGSNVKVDKIYSEDENVEYIKAYKKNGEDWEEISSNSFDNL